MVLNTPVEIPTPLPQLTHRNRLWVMGSCFATAMGERLTAAKFRCDVNPYGVLYNPLSISTALHEIATKRHYEEKDLFYHRECWHSPMHNETFSSPDRDETLQQINERIHLAHRQIREVSCLLITFGSAWVYEQISEGKQQVVGNCHKLPEQSFTRRCLSIEEIVHEYSERLPELWRYNPSLQILLTVSPIRHLREGLHANQLSKATLLLAVEKLKEKFQGKVFYFPAYEILLDELRDYRFYAEDLVHPSETAVRYVWERFISACCPKETLKLIEETEKIHKALMHRPFRKDSKEYKCFLEQIVLNIEQLNQKYPYLDFQNEWNLCHTRLKA